MKSIVILAALLLGCAGGTLRVESVLVQCAPMDGQGSFARLSSDAITATTWQSYTAAGVDVNGAERPELDTAYDAAAGEVYVDCAAEGVTSVRFYLPSE